MKTKTAWTCCDGIALISKGDCFYAWEKGELGVLMDSHEFEFTFTYDGEEEYDLYKSIDPSSVIEVCGHSI